MIISQAKNLGIDADIIKIMTGKSVKKDILTYMTDINIKEAFQKLQTTTAINGTLIKPESENQLITLGKTVVEMQEKIEQLESRIKDQTDRLFELEQLVPPTRTINEVQKRAILKTKQRSLNFLFLSLRGRTST